MQEKLLRVRFLRIVKSIQVADILSEKLDCDVVQVIGSKFVLYKPNPDEPVIKLPRANK